MKYRTGSKRTGRVIPAIAGGVLLAVAAFSPACKGVVVQTLQPSPEPIVGEIGYPCQTGDENSPNFAGYRVTEENVADRIKGCNSGVCLVNHVQGRADCPLGQEAPSPCAGPSDPSCGAGFTCAAAGTAGPFCYFPSVDGGAPDVNPSNCPSGVCNSPRNTCQCTTDAQCPDGSTCDPATKECTRYVCHHVGECQSAGATEAENAGKSCCAGGEDVPVTAAVCGQCEKGSGRNPAEDIYCSCRCGPADGAAPDGAEYCACPSGFECAPIRPDVGLGDQELTGKFCIKQGTAYTDPGQCGAVSGHLASYCDGTPAP